LFIRLTSTALFLCLFRITGRHALPSERFVRLAAVCFLDRPSFRSCFFHPVFVGCYCSCSPFDRSLLGCWYLFISVFSLSLSGFLTWFFFLVSSLFSSL
jgi:hypothetical protein